MQQFFSPVIENAIRLASFWHRGQMRKGNEFDYIIHPFSVAMILSKAGFDDEVVAAGLCHDLLEDTDCPEDEIVGACGERVLDIVETVSEDLSDNLSWEEKKERYIQKVRNGSWEAKAVCAADKIHNLQSLIESLNEYGIDYFKYFHRGPEKKLWFEDQVCLMLQQTWQHELIQEYDQLLDQLVDLLETMDEDGDNFDQLPENFKSDFDEPEVRKVEYGMQNAEMEEEVLSDLDAPHQIEEKDLVEDVAPDVNEQVADLDNEIEYYRQKLEELNVKHNVEKFVKQQNQQSQQPSDEMEVKLIDIQPEEKKKKRGRPRKGEERSKNGVQFKYISGSEIALLGSVLGLACERGEIDGQMMQKTLRMSYLSSFRMLKELKRLHVIKKADGVNPRKVIKSKAKEILKAIGK